jgi:hypothetical protein
MSALPSFVTLRRHAMPADFLCRLRSARLHFEPKPLPVARPRLVADWSCDAEGRSICRWRIERVRTPG